MKLSDRGAKYYNSGFTLVELMIVMAIVGLLVSLVGPLTIDALSRAHARSELLTIKSWFKFQSQKAFVSGTQMDFIFKQSSIHQLVNTQVILVKKFDYVSFQPQNITYNRQGILDKNTLLVTFNGEEIIINLSDWTDEHEF